MCKHAEDHGKAGCGDTPDAGGGAGGEGIKGGAQAEVHDFGTQRKLALA